jgi:hypothetical protein
VSTLQQVRDKVRLQADLDEDDLPDATLDGYIREAFDQTFAVEARWPFFEYTWDLVKAEDATTIARPTVPEVAFIQRFRDSSNFNLLHIDAQQAEETFQGVISTTDTPEFFSVWGDVISLWPTPTAAAQTFTMRGYRKPTWSDTPSATLDGDTRLHLPIFHYAVALAYAQMEDPELEGTYMQRWGSTLNTIRRDIMQPQHAEPLILNGGSRIRSRRGLVAWGDIN